MALGKTVSYTPFNETSFGYGSDEIRAAHGETAYGGDNTFPNATDIVKVTIQHGSGNWDTTGHLATPSIGTAVATYHKLQEYWTVKGERDDVDAVLAAMSFFPADKPETRLWNPTAPSHALKDNQTSGNYGLTEEPPTIGDTDFTLRVYDGATPVSTQTVTFAVTEAVFGNQRPYWSVAPTNEDLNTTEHGQSGGGLLDLGTISHGTDTENVQVKCQFRHYGFSTPTSGALGSITQDENIYIGDKKPATSDNQEARFDFTGSVAEAQAFLDNVRYYDAGNQQTFDMFLTVTDGVVGSTLTKTCYFSNNVVTVSAIPNVHYVEDDNPAYWDFTELDFVYDNMKEVDTFTATITLDATGIANTASFDTSITVNTNSYNPTTGVLTISDDQILVLKAALRNLRYTPIADANSPFTMTVDFTFSSSTVGSSYSSTQQTINVTAQDVSEVSNLTTTHTWTEDKWYDFPITNIPQISHGRNDNFDVIFTLSDADAGVLGRHVTSGTAFFTPAYGTSAQYKLQGTKNEVNEALKNLYFAPSADYDDDFTIAFTVDRTSGDLTYETQSVGSMTMNAIAVDEIGFPLERPHITWRNNVSTDFASGLQIQDTSYTIVGSPNYKSTYTVKMLLRQLYDHGASGFQFDQGVLKIKDEYVDLLDVVTDNRTNSVTITGNRDAVNLALEDLTFIPDPLYAERNRHYVIYEVTRDADGVVLQNYSASVLTWIDNAIIDETGYSVNAQLFDWVEDIPFEFDTQFSITEELTGNADYTSDNGYDNWYGSFYKVTIRGKYHDGSNDQELPQINFTTTTAPNANLLVSGSGTVSDPLVLQGSKAELNKAFATMKMSATEIDFTNSPETHGTFYFEHKVERVLDNSSIINYNEILGNFNAGTPSPAYLATWNRKISKDTWYDEDVANQNVFSHLGDVVLEDLQNLFGATYNISIALSNETTGKFVPYVADGYFEDDEVNVVVSDYLITMSGTSVDINKAIKDIEFTPYADVFANVNIVYSQTRILNNVSTVQANNVVVATMNSVDAPEFIYGNTNNNIQYFVQDEFAYGVDLSKSEDQIVQSEANVTLTPRQLATNLKFNYDVPIVITDTVPNAQYKIEFATGTLGTQYGGTLSVLDTDWQSREAIADILKDGVMVTGINENTQIFHDQIIDVNFILSRKLSDGTTSQLGQGTLQYQFLAGLSLWHIKQPTETNYYSSYRAYRIDNLPLIQTDPYEATALQEINCGVKFKTNSTQRSHAPERLYISEAVNHNRADPYSATYRGESREINARLFNHHDREDPTSTFRNRATVTNLSPNNIGRHPLSDVIDMYQYNRSIELYDDRYLRGSVDSPFVSNRSFKGNSFYLDLSPSGRFWGRMYAEGDSANDIFSQHGRDNFGMTIWTNYGVKLFVGSSLSPLDMKAINTNVLY